MSQLVHYVIGRLTGTDWDGRRVSYPALACAPYNSDELLHTGVPEDVTCGKCLERMANETEKSLGPIIVDTSSWLRDAF